MKRISTQASLALASLLALFLGGAPSFALTSALQDDGEQAEGEQDAESEEADEADEEQETWFAIVGGDVYTGNGGLLRGATILSKNGVIKAIGHDVYLPEGTETLDATGMRVYPGLIALEATSRISRGLFGSGSTEDAEPGEDELDPHLGLDDVGRTEVPAGWYGHVVIDDDAWSESAAAQKAGSDVSDSFDPFSQYLVLALATGITTAEQSDAAVKLKRGEIDDIVMHEKNLSTFSWSVRNPGSIRSTKEKFAAAAKYLRDYRLWEDRPDDRKEEKEPTRSGVDTSALRVLKGNTRARFNANEREDLLGIARFAQEYGFRPVIYGCREGWTVADELGRAGAFAVITPRDRRDKSEELLRPGGSSIENAAILHASGVQVAVIPANTSFDLGGITGRDLMHLPIEAAFAVRGGMTNEAALEALTVIPARILGVDHRVGTLEVGKDMDAIVTDGDILHYQTFVQYAVVAGKLGYDKQEEIFFAHIRPRPERVVDPGEEPVQEEAAAEGEDTAEDDAEEGDDAQGEDAGDEEGGDDEE